MISNFSALIEDMGQQSYSVLILLMTQSGGLDVDVDRVSWRHNMMSPDSLVLNSVISMTLNWQAVIYNHLK